MSADQSKLFIHLITQGGWKFDDHITNLIDVVYLLVEFELLPWNLFAVLSLSIYFMLTVEKYMIMCNIYIRLALFTKMPKTLINPLKCS